MSDGAKLNTRFTARVIFDTGTVSVPNVSMCTLTGSGWPMA